MRTLSRAVTRRLAAVPKVLSIFVVVAVLVSMVVALYPGGGQRHLSVDFPRTVSLYEGSDVRILGVPVGTVESISPRGDTVRVRLSYSDEYKLPKDVKAAIVSPAIIGDRFVQLAPAYSGGDVLADNSHLDTQRTATPVELDEVYRTLDDLSVALGPDGANKNGALSRLVDASAANLGGEGKRLNQTVGDLSKLTETLANNKDNLFGSVKQVERFVAMLKANDRSVRAFNTSLGDVSSVLEGERQDLAATLRVLASTLADVDDFVQHNRKALRTNVHDLTELSKTVVKQRKALDEAFKAAPSALSNLAFTYNPAYGTLDNRTDILGAITDTLDKPGRALCQLLGLQGTSSCKQVRGLVEPLTGAIPGGLLRTAPGDDAAAAPSIDPDPVNDSVAEMLAVR